MVVEHNRRSTWTGPLRELRDAPLGGHCGETMEQEGGEPTIYNLPYLSRHPNRTHEQERLWLEQRRNLVKGYDTTQHWGSTKSRTQRVRPNVGKDRVCIFGVWWDEIEMRWCLRTLGSAWYILPVTLSTSITSVFPYTCHRSLKMYLEAAIERDWRWTWRLRSSKLRDALVGRDQASLGMHLQTEIEWTERCTWRKWLSEFGDALGGRDWVNSEMHLEAVIECIWRYTWRPWSINIGEVLGGGRSGERRDGSWHSIHWLICKCGNVERCVDLPRDEKLAGSGRQSIMEWCSTWCMLDSVLTD